MTVARITTLNFKSKEVLTKCIPMMVEIWDLPLSLVDLERSSKTKVVQTAELVSVEIK